MSKTHDIPAAPEDVVELAVNLDDVTGELIGHASQALLDAGALDVWTTAVTMKKQRPGVMLCVLAAPDDADAMAERMLRLTGSFGVRMRRWQRLVLDRRQQTVPTRFGQVTVKIGSLRGRDVVARPEYESVRALAERAGVEFRDAQRAADAAVESAFGELHQTSEPSP